MNRFIADKNTVLDTNTGLMWLKDAGIFEFPLTWAEALESVKELNASGFGGFNDWQLPNRRELFSLISHEKINPSLPEGHPFENVFAGYYWTSTSCTRLPDQAWYIHLGGAKVYRGMKYGSYMVWPVRVADNADPKVQATGQRQCYDEAGNTISCHHTGQDGELQSGLPMPASRFEAQENVVYDRATGLTWTKHANIAGNPVDWPSALKMARQMNRASGFGYGDWRVPTVTELESLTCMARHSPAMVSHPFYDVQAFYWSSTTSAYNTDYAWVLYMQDGAVGVGYKPLPEFYLWLVTGISHGGA